jgi:hypothetical protein
VAKKGTNVNPGPATVRRGAVSPAPAGREPNAIYQGNRILVSAPTCNGANFIRLDGARLEGLIGGDAVEDSTLTRISVVSLLYEIFAALYSCA